jgi:molecular chaperone DnaK (HSP70)
MAQIGIDFGTTNSLLVAYNKDRNMFYYFSFDEFRNPTPTSSTVWYYDQTKVIGSEAREKINTYSHLEGHHFEKSIKLKLGQQNGINIFGKSVQPYIIAADILKHIKNKAEQIEKEYPSGVDFNRAIFTIPINFDGVQRNALRKAAQEAGIEVTTFIHEPFAAVVGHFFTKETDLSAFSVINKLENLNGKFLLIFDWGGGTLDITVVKVENGKMLELGTAELTGKAGDKFDEDIAKWAWSKFLERHGEKYNEAIIEQKRKENWDKLVSRAERCKIFLSTQNSVDFRAEDIIDNLGITENLTREDFEKLIEHTLLDASNEIDKAIKEAGIGEVNIDLVLLTGGSCYIPAVQEKLKDKFGHKVNTVKRADSLIAEGAAVISEMGWLPFLTKDISIQLSDDSLYPIFEKNTTIAADGEARKSEDLVCSDNRGGDAKIIIVEGDGQRKDKNLAILKVPVRNNSKFNDDIKLDAILNRDIILKVMARSLMVNVEHKRPEDEFTVQKSTEIHQLCFGLDFKTVK